MAVLALGFAGQAIGGAIGGSILGVSAATIGGFVGQAVGGMIDNVLFPTKQQGPRVTDSSVTCSTYGTAIPVLWGPENRTAPNMIWAGPLIESSSKSKSGGKGGPTVVTTQYSYSRSVAYLFAGKRRLQNILKLWANGKLIFDNSDGGVAPDADGVVYATKSDGTHIVFDSITFYCGTATQPADPTIEADKGMGNAPAYRGSAYMVIDRLQLADYGNRLPNFEALLAADEEPVALNAIVMDLTRMSGMSDNDVAVAGLAGLTVRGLKVTDGSQAIQVLQPLALAYAFDCCDQGGSVRFLKRGRATRGRITYDDMGGHVSSDTPPEKVKFERTQDIALPFSAALTFIDPERNYQPNTARSARILSASMNDLSSSLPIVVSADEAQSVCDRMLWEPWTARRSAMFNLTDRFQSVRAGDVWTLDSPDPLTDFKCTRVTRGFNGLLETEWRADDPSLYNSTNTGAGASIPANPLRLPGESLFVPMNLPLLTDQDDPYGFYWSVAGSGNGWRGADVRRSVDGGATFTSMSPSRSESTLGSVALATPDGPVTGYDTSATIRVVLHREDMTLESVSDDFIDAGANAFYLGVPDDDTAEVLQFKTATLVSPGVYDLTDLVRGLKGTEFATGLHGTNETFVLLNSNTVARSGFGASDIGVARDFKAVSVLTDEADAADVPFTNAGTGQRPYAPNHLTDDRALTPADINFGWDRRARTGGDLRGNGTSLPYLDGPDAYRVQIMDAAGTSVVRTIDVTAPAAVYLLADQASDFPTGLPTDLIWRVAQASNVYPAGFSPWALGTATA